MKIRNLIGVGFIAFLIAACRGSDKESLQQIDQTVNFYISDAQGKDLLIPNDSFGYNGRINWFDLDAISVNVSVSGPTYGLDSTLNKNYFQYLAGATRILVDSTSPQSKTYRSDVLMTMKNGLRNAVADSDTIRLVYSWAPSLFQIQQVYLNRKLIFTKTPGQKNKVFITK